MAETLNSPQLQPQESQLEVLFKGPLVKDAQVATLADLIELSTQSAYEHKIVWVKSEKCNYYLDSGDGTSAENWKRLATRAAIEKYDPEQTYELFEAVYIGGSIYTAKQHVDKYTYPADNDDYWQMIAGETITYRYVFNNAPSTIIYTEIRNPNFSVYLGDPVVDAYGEIVLDENGFAAYTDTELIDAPVIRRDDLVDGTGVAYEVMFYEDNDLSPQTGFVNVK